MSRQHHPAAAVAAESDRTSQPWVDHLVLEAGVGPPLEPPLNAPAPATAPTPIPAARPIPSAVAPRVPKPPPSPEWAAPELGVLTPLRDPPSAAGPHAQIQSLALPAATSTFARRGTRSPPPCPRA